MVGGEGQANDKRARYKDTEGERDWSSSKGTGEKRWIV